MAPVPPQTVTQLLALLFKTSGLGALVAVAFGFALIHVYQDLGRRNDAFVDLLRENIRESRAVADSLEKLVDSIDSKGK